MCQVLFRQESARAVAAAVVDLISTTIEELLLIRQSHKSILVSFSGGKDSLTLLYLAKQIFEHVECFFMYFVPGIRSVEDRIDDASEKYNVKIYKIRHWAYFKCKKHGIFCNPEDIEERVLSDVYTDIRELSGITPILTGAKRDDGQWRRTNTANAITGAYGDVYKPIFEWTTYDVLGYCKMKGIEVPKAEGMKNTGIDLGTKYILWAYNNDKQAYSLIKKEFPYLDAMIYREKWFNVTRKNKV